MTDGTDEHASQEEIEEVAGQPARSCRHAEAPATAAHPRRADSTAANAEVTGRQGPPAYRDSTVGHGRGCSIAAEPGRGGLTVG